MPETSVSGRCFCGAVRFEVTLPTLFCGYCHCSMCQRAHGAGFVAWCGVPYERFRVTAGEDRLVRRKSSDHGTRSFCGECGSQLLCESTNHPDWIDVTLASMQGPIDREPEAHYFVDDRAAWTHLDDGLPRFGGATGIEPR
jgi:hypothetical protein